MNRQHFQQALDTYFGFRQKLLNYRSVSDSIQEAGASVRDVLRALQMLYGTVSVRLIFYQYQKKELGIWITDTQDIVTYKGLTGGDRVKEKLEHWELELKSALKLRQLGENRAPRLRSLELEAEVIQNPRPIKEIIKDLSTTLFPPDITDHIEGVKNLVIFPTGNIGTLPLSLLNISEQSILDQCTLTIAPDVFDLIQSAQLASEHPHLRPYSFQRPLIIGNPQYPEEEYYFPNLPGAEQETQNLYKRLGKGTLLLGKEAKKSAFLKDAEEADLLYFATHGIASPKNPLDDSFLVFTPDSQQEGSRLASAKWTAREIQHSSLKARLAILSACQTGLGKSHDAGTIGLSRAFRFAGVDNVIMSLWNVSDEATAELMQILFDELLNDEPSTPAYALRKAQLALRERWDSPAYWASFASFGIP